ncbi:helix-turn-helix domain-containing protein [Bacillaceae bacterium Marseille-Q3522]|nr:helix-turn-helix domain-containing protein [Bacillaceae bacterium Marseille-Q3522]
MSNMFSVEELARELNVTTRTIRNYLRDGKLKGTKIGGQWRFSKENLFEFIGHDDSYEAKNGLVYRFLEEKHDKEVSVIVLDFSVDSLEILDTLRERIVNYYNEVYEGENRIFQYQLLPKQVARFTLIGPIPYVLGFSDWIYRLAETLKLGN